MKWAVDLNQGNQVLDEGIFKFLHSSGMPFLSNGEGGVEGELEPGQTYSLGVLFCPSKMKQILFRNILQLFPSDTHLFSLWKEANQMEILKSAIYVQINSARSMVESVQMSFAKCLS